LQLHKTVYFTELATSSIGETGNFSAQTN